MERHIWPYDGATDRQSLAIAILQVVGHYSKKLQVRSISPMTANSDSTTLNFGLLTHYYVQKGTLEGFGLIFILGADMDA